MARFSRLLEPEWLDCLPANDVRARRSRADLRRINALMGNTRILARQLERELPYRQSLRIADLGGGDGTLMLAVARRLRCHDVSLALVDRAPILERATARALAGLGWKAIPEQCDALAFLQACGRFDAIIANLFLHHFDAGSLSRLLGLVAARTALFIACEPARSRLALAASRLVGLLGCNDVTRHDAVASVRAGFSGRELSRAWPRSPGWRLHETPVRPFTHLFVARRESDA
jgi:hypothetical protein